jgi:hypothetical protein
MLQLKNNTPFATSFALFPNEDAIDTLYIIVRATFNIGQKWTLSDNQQPPVEKDIYWDEPENSSIKMASDFHIGKPATDIIMNGHACAPEGKQATQLDVSLKVGHVSKTVRVFGDRVWNSGMMTSPVPFTRMPIKYERAYGGHYKINETHVSASLFNPVGTGFAGERKNHEVDGLALPNIEDPKQLISSIKDNPIPAGFGALSPAWQPRSNYAGTYDEAWEITRAPYLPHDFDKRFMNMAHPDLIYPGFLHGGEPVEVINMHPKGNLHFTLPVINLATTVDINKRTESPTFNMETVIIDPDTLQLGMVWKAALNCDKEALKIKQLTVNLSR